MQQQSGQTSAPCASAESVGPRESASSCASALAAPESDDAWLGLTADPLPVSLALEWAVLPSCGAVVLFSGTARDHAPGRPGVDLLEYEAYESQVTPRLQSLAHEMRRRWNDLGRIALLHRVGAIAIGETAVVVVVSAPHRETAFAAARFGIDAVKATVPIWKRERWQGGEDWGLDSQPLTTAPRLGCTPAEPAAGRAVIASPNETDTIRTADAAGCAATGSTL